MTPGEIPTPRVKQDLHPKKKDLMVPEGYNALRDNRKKQCGQQGDINYPGSPCK